MKKNKFLNSIFFITFLSNFFTTTIQPKLNELEAKKQATENKLKELKTNIQIRNIKIDELKEKLGMIFALPWAHNFWHDIMGTLNEQDFFNRIGTGIEKNRELVEAVSKAKNISFGEFQTYSIQELENSVKNKPAFSEQGLFQIIIHPKAEVKAIQASPSFENAVFQIASNFNCIEGAYNGIVNHLRDGVQGEQASIGALPGTILRTYCVNPKELQLLFNLEGKEVNTYTQTKKMLPGFRVKNLINPESWEHQNMTHRIKIGYHSDISVTHGQNFKKVIHDQKIDQVFTSALYLNDIFRKNVVYNIDKPTAAMPFLWASYLGTIYGAHLYGRQKVVLTLMGCGAFANYLKWLIPVFEWVKQYAVNNNMQVYVIVRGNQDQYNCDREDDLRNLDFKNKYKLEFGKDHFLTDDQIKELFEEAKI